MVKVYCPKHKTEHTFKPTEAAQLVKHYMNELVLVGYQEPLPNIAGISTPMALAAALCPADDLAKIKDAHAPNVGFDGSRMPTLSKIWQETFLKQP